MTKAEFKQLTAAGLVFSDGATVSNLMKRGMPAGVCPELWIMEHPDSIIALQREYVEAGSQIIYTPTFTGNRIKLAEYGLADRLEEINTRLAGLSRQAAAGKALVAGDLSMTGIQVKPTGPMELEELIEIYREQIKVLAAAGVDLLVVETMMSLQETRAALIAARESCSLPVMATMTFEADGKTLFGTDGRTAAVVLESLGADAVGVNCSAGPAKLLPVLQSMAAVTDLPLIAKPNAGLPSLNQAGETVYDMDEATFRTQIKELIDAGAGILGGCCGTAPSYIAAVTTAYRKLSINDAVKVKPAGTHFLTSERQTLSFGLTEPFLFVGERINPTGKKKLQEELRSGNLDTVLRFVEEQEEAGAAILDVNVGMGGIDEEAVMLKVIEEVSLATSLPLAVDTSHVAVMEAALRRYPGRALINSISAEQAKIEGLLPLAAKYGAMFILLPLSDAGLPENMAEKIGLIDKITARALELGMKKEDIIVDGLVTTVGANPIAAMEVLETIRYCKEQGLATICGLSNISFGLPERSFVNTTFLTMAIKEGLTMAIANPCQELLVNCALAADLLLHKPEADNRYLDWMSRYAGAKANRMVVPDNPHPGIAAAPGAKEPPVNQTAAAAAEVSDSGNPAAAAVKEAVLKGKRSKIEELIRAALADGLEARKILDDALLPAIQEVGELFDQGKYFLPQLIAGAETMSIAVELLEPLLLQKGGGAAGAAVVIATVAGDIHDIGKNLVVLMLKNYGYRVIDLGKDVNREYIIEQAEHHQAQIIALSALMTTTMLEMKRVIELVRAKQLPVKVIIGGAVITQEYADEIGADGYAKDAADTVRVIKNLLDKPSLTDKD